jgi:hypothetical protein
MSAERFAYNVSANAITDSRTGGHWSLESEWSIEAMVRAMNQYFGDQPRTPLQVDGSKRQAGSSHISESTPFAHDGEGGVQVTLPREVVEKVADPFGPDVLRLMQIPSVVEACRQALSGLLREATEIINDLTEAEVEPCSYDHHGDCQTHGWFETDPICAVRRGREFVAKNYLTQEPDDADQG